MTIEVEVQDDIHFKKSQWKAIWIDEYQRYRVVMGPCSIERGVAEEVEEWRRAIDATTASHQTRLTR